MGHEQISISARAAIEYIAGVIDRQRFETLTDDWILQNLRQALDSGATVYSMCIRRNPDGDDDALDMRWRGHDPAASPFTAEHTRP
jgi:hypothetical protein